MDLTLRRGDTATLTIPLLDGATAYTPPAGATAIFTIKRRLTDADSAALVQKQTGGAGVTFSTSNAQVSILNADTATLTDTLAYYDVQVQEASGRVLTAAFGQIALPKDVTVGLDPAIPINTTDPATAWATGKTLWVDATNGNDTTGTRGLQNLPFATIPAAITAASSGDLVHVRPGTYSAQVILKNGVNLHFDSDAIVSNSVIDNGVSVECSITGNGTFLKTVTSGVLMLTNAAFELTARDSSVSLQARRVRNGLPSASEAYGIFTHAPLVARILEDLSSQEYDAIKVAEAASPVAFAVHVAADEVVGGTQGQAVEMNTVGTLYLSARRWDGAVTEGLCDMIRGTLVLDVLEDYDNAQVYIDDGARFIEARGRPQVLTTERTASIDQLYHVVDSCPILDPATPVEGKGYTVFVRNGTATVGGVDYSTAGTIIRRVYLSGSWASYRYLPS